VASVAFDIDHSGAAAGYTTNRFDVHSAALWRSESTQTLEGPSQADSIGASGTITGTTWTTAGARATVWKDTGAWYLDIGGESYGLGIDSYGRVVGSVTEGGRAHAFLYDGGTLTDIGGGWRWSAAYDISDSGRAVGTYDLGGGAFRAFSWSADEGFRDIGTLGGGDTYAMAVNSRGQVAGSSKAGGQLRAFLYDNGSMRNLGTLGGASMAYDVNAGGNVVGYSYDRSGRSRAFVWRDGILFDLNLLIDPGSGWTLTAAYGINDRGQIVGSGWYSGQQMGFRLDPVLVAPSPIRQSADAAEAPVPEPATFSIAAGALALIGGARFLAGRR
jgi:probable HAF family extracellular repeat protein